MNSSTEIQKVSKYEVGVPSGGNATIVAEKKMHKVARYNETGNNIMVPVSGSQY